MTGSIIKIFQPQGDGLLPKLTTRKQQDLAVVIFDLVHFFMVIVEEHIMLRVHTDMLAVLLRCCQRLKIMKR